jgi:glutamate/tyrosine decarboxylase-like PLP-dependent enzyme
MHEITGDLREAVFNYARNRLSYSPPPLDHAQPENELARLAGPTITESGIGGVAALKVFELVLAPATISTDHPGYLSFIPSAPTEASKLFDLIVSASAIYGGSWLEGAGAVYAENEVLAWLASECGLPASAGGVFVQGGTIGNLSALVAARRHFNAPAGKRLAFVCSSEAHSSLKSAARIMDVDIVVAKADENGQLHGSAVAEAIAADDVSRIFAVVATAGTTNFGIVDHIASIADVAKQHGKWLHVDGAYGLAGILSKSHRKLYAGVEHADSVIVDPHKWLFAPFDACALIYRNPELARQAHTQHGEYLDTLTESGEWNPSDYAINLTRRPRGLPLWFSLATHGVAAYRKAVETNCELAVQAAELIRARDDLKLVREPMLSVVVFEKLGWSKDDYQKWSDRLLAEQVAFVVPSSHAGTPNLRFAIVNPLTDLDLIKQILDSIPRS